MINEDEEETKGFRRKMYHNVPKSRMTAGTI